MGAGAEAMPWGRGWECSQEAILETPPPLDIQFCILASAPKQWPDPAALSVLAPGGLAYWFMQPRIILGILLSSAINSVLLPNPAGNLNVQAAQSTHFENSQTLPKP